MEQGTFLFALLLILVIAFSAFGGGTAGQPISTPPNAQSEFGVARPERTSFFSRPASQGTSGSTSKPPASETPSQTPEEFDELLKKSFSVSPRNARSRDEKTEYISISYSGGSKAPESVNISNWTISNARGESFKLGNTTTLPGISPIQNQDQLVLKKGSTVYVITGRSPIGINFRKNKCMAYYNQYYSFIPGISSSCPAPSREPGQEGFTDRCYLFVKNLNSCVTTTKFPLDLDSNCQEYVLKTASYNGCVNNHKGDANFYQNEWWTYLNRPGPIWSEVRDTITLTNERGTVIASYSYN